MGYVLGITGAIGSGKSTLATLLRDMEPSHAVYETSEVIIEVAEDFNRALSGELAFETTTNDVELVNQALIWFIEAISERLHQSDVTWNQLAITKHHLAAHPKLFEKMFIYVDAAKKSPSMLDGRITADNKEHYRPLLQWLGGYLVAKISDTIWYDELFRRISIHDSDKNLVIIGGVRYPSDAAAIREHNGLVLGIERPDHSADRDDVTESSRSLIKPDIIVHNTGSLAELAATAEQLWHDLGAGKHKTSYTV
jgi:hypothetical protein